ncbi:MAG: hypothetical protein WCL57_11800, partial [Chloroflexota bacterium]
MQTAIRKSTLLCLIGTLAAAVCSATITILYATSIATNATNSNELATNSSQYKAFGIAAKPINRDDTIDI